MVYVYLALYIEIANGDFIVLLAIMEEKLVARSARHSAGIFFIRFNTPPIIYHSTPRFEHPPHQPEVGASTSDHPPIQVTCAGPPLTGTRGGGHFKVTLV